MPELAAEKRAKVEALFKEWDEKDTVPDAIDRAKLESKSIDVGPHKQKVFAAFAKMDANQDNLVTLQEMVNYFAVLASVVTDDEFDTAVGELTDAARNERAVSESLQLAMSMQQPTPVAPAATGSEEGEEGEEAPELPPELQGSRLELVEALFAAFSPDGAPIDLGAIKDDGNVEIGPSRQKAIAGLVQMDANGDGLVEKHEMLTYFRFVAAELDDEMFEQILQELRDSAARGQVLRVAVGAG